MIYLSSVHQHPHLWHLNVLLQISSTVPMFKVPLKMPHRTEGGMFVDEASASLWLSTFCLVMVCGRMCKTRGTAWWGMFTNHKLQLYVQTEYKTQSENSIKKLRDQLMPWHRSNPNSKKWRLPMKTNKTIHNTRDQYSHKIRLLRPSHTNMQG